MKRLENEASSQLKIKLNKYSLVTIQFYYDNETESFILYNKVTETDENKVTSSTYHFISRLISAFKLNAFFEV